MAEEVKEETILEAVTEEETSLANLGLGVTRIPPMTAEQKDIIELPVDDLSLDQLFTYVPLVGRLTEGVDKVTELAQR